eukprot:c12532_g1_i1.p1 GENE.c12532_g1_i1~~c12532_g1_i1.p1  ORF type:complete len:1285 (+),score=388.92 c12532_g1_i1:461-3856(+)
MSYDNRHIDKGLNAASVEVVGEAMALTNEMFEEASGNSSASAGAGDFGVSSNANEMQSANQQQQNDTDSNSKHRKRKNSLGGNEMQLVQINSRQDSAQDGVVVNKVQDSQNIMIKSVGESSTTADPSRTLSAASSWAVSNTLVFVEKESLNRFVVFTSTSPSSSATTTTTTSSTSSDSSSSGPMVARVCVAGAPSICIHSMQNVSRISASNSTKNNTSTTSNKTNNSTSGGNQTISMVGQKVLSRPFLAIHQSLDTVLFNRSASFFLEMPGLAGGATVSLRSFAFPSLYVCRNEVGILDLMTVIPHMRNTSLQHKVCSWKFEFPDLALRHPTKQSSTVSTASEFADASRAVEGTRGLCASTTFETNPWWRVDLQQVATVSHVRVTTNDTRMEGSIVYVGDSAEADKFVANSSKCGVVAKVAEAIKEGGEIEVTCNPPASGRYVYVAQSGDGVIVLCGVQVFGTGSLKLDAILPSTSSGYPSAISFPPALTKTFAISLCFQTKLECSIATVFDNSGVCGFLDARPVDQYIDESSGSNLGFGLTFGNGNVLYGYSGNSTLSTPATMDLADNNNHHVLATRNSETGECSLVVDGVPQAIRTLPEAPLSTEVLVVGGFGTSGGSGQFTGKISSFRMFDDLLDSSMIADEVSVCGAGCFERDVTLQFVRVKGCGITKPLGAIGSSNCTESIWHASNVLASRISILFGSHYHPLRDRSDKMALLVNGMKKIEMFNDNCNMRINSHGCTHSVTLPQGQHDLLLTASSGSPIPYHPSVIQVKVLECEGIESETKFAPPNVGVPDGCSVVDFLPEFSLADGCAAKMPNGILRMGNCYATTWSYTGAFSQLVLVFESDDSNRRDRKESMVVSIDGTEIKTFTNDGCNREHEGKACQTILDAGVVSVDHEVVIKAKSLSKKAETHGKLGVAQGVVCMGASTSTGSNSRSAHQSSHVTSSHLQKEHHKQQQPENIPSHHKLANEKDQENDDNDKNADDNEIEHSKDEQNHVPGLSTSSGYRNSNNDNINDSNNSNNVTTDQNQDQLDHSITAEASSTTTTATDSIPADSNTNTNNITSITNHIKWIIVLLACACERAFSRLLNNHSHCNLRVPTHRPTTLITTTAATTISISVTITITGIRFG